MSNIAFTGSCFEAPTSLLLRLISAAPGYDAYERMVNDDECAVCICMSVFLCVGVFCFVKYHMSQDRSGSCIVV